MHHTVMIIQWLVYELVCADQELTTVFMFVCVLVLVEMFLEYYTKKYNSEGVNKRWHAKTNRGGGEMLEIIYHCFYLNFWSSGKK